MSDQGKVFPQTYKKEDRRMESTVVKEGFEAAQKELRDKQIAEVKKIVTKTLEKIDLIEHEKKDLRDKERQLDEDIKLLKSDIDDLKDGRIDRIIERQEKDPKARDVSVVVIIKEKETVREIVNSPYPNTWYEPYYVYWSPILPRIWNATSDLNTSGNGTLTINTSMGSLGSNTISSMSISGSDVQCEDNIVVTNSAAKFAVIGTYDINGKIINLR